MRAVIQGTGMFVPPHQVHNDRLGLVMDTTDEWIQQRTGIVTRHFAEAGVATSDLALPAARQALAQAGLEPNDIDYVVFATMTPDYLLPGLGGRVRRQDRDEAACPASTSASSAPGSSTGCRWSDALIRSGQYRRVLLIGAEVHGGLQPWRSWDIVLGDSDRAVGAEEYARNTTYRDRTVLFGDGAGAVVLTAEADDSRGVVDVLLHTDGALYDRLMGERWRQRRAARTSSRRCTRTAVPSRSSRGARCSGSP